MAKASPRARQIGDQMHRELAQLLQFHLKDPRVGMVTVTAVEVNRDLDFAKVFVTILQQHGTRAEVIKILNAAGGFLRKEMARRIRLRIMPKLEFVYDQSLEHGNYMSSLIDAAVAGDAAGKQDEEE